MFESSLTSHFPLLILSTRLVVYVLGMHADSGGIIMSDSIGKATASPKDTTINGIISAPAIPVMMLLSNDLAARSVM
ncbi:hypothetical protein YYU_04205 [Anaplasma phagocytophilum str. HZ2]|nr:hypothetical protein YYU_04205 [Anaplasma phagocytophilum str. HZ2]AGR82063.1 hypothetical protein YYY_04220 [Anaplasma phagocytophilum str. Dog2]PLC09623.1 hypothetical protein C0V68_05865 [Anaplasma phagocytophilum]